MHVIPSLKIALTNELWKSSLLFVISQIRLAKQFSLPLLLILWASGLWSNFNLHRHQFFKKSFQKEEILRLMAETRNWVNSECHDLIFLLSSEGRDFLVGNNGDQVALLPPNSILSFNRRFANFIWWATGIQSYQFWVLLEFICDCEIFNIFGWFCLMG